MMMKINAIQCSVCGDIIYSRYRHDFRWCSCPHNENNVGEGCFIDGGFDYQRVGGKHIDKIKHLVIEVDTTYKNLYDDWNLKIDKFGLIKKEQISKEYKCCQD